MLVQILLQLLKNKWFWVALLVIGIGYTFYNLYTENQLLKLQKAQLVQNNAAARDELTKTRDSIVVMTAYVGDLNIKTDALNDENRRLKGEVKAWKAKYDLSIDSVRILNQVITGYMIGDSIAVAPFEGKKGITAYKGETQMNIKTKASKLSFLNLDFDIIKAKAELFLDETDGLWKMRTISETPDVKLKGVSTIDNDTFRRLAGVSPPADERTRVLGLGAILGKNLFAPGIELRPSAWQIGAHYTFFDNSKVLDNWQDRILVSLHYFIF